MLRKAGRVLAPIAAGALLFTAACGDNVGTEDVEEGEDRDTMELGTGSTGGDYYPFGTGIADMWSQKTDIKVSGIETGASVENLTKISQGEMDLGMAVNGTATGAQAGEGDFAEVEANFQFMGNLYPEVMHIVATEESGIETIDDLEGQRVALGPDGSGTAALSETILETAGVEVDGFHDGFGDAGNKMRDGQLDAAFGILSVPSSTITEVANAIDINFVEIPSELSEELRSNDPTMSTYTIEDGDYEGVSGDWTTVSNWASIYCDPALSEDQVYELTKALYEDIGDVSHALSGNVEIENAVKGLQGIEIHPGAKRYFEEQDLL
ncbi:TAXI family TRAP transporter solute-binding subunit [Haloglycomyces albus]|uniref:TAXI family TRAP transporter solute-binding subunit n=1 Tax=Haloglycomyces albus TaxID=526067 RepID=UPI0004A3FD27|nr:TAXI family TRAP transporter solute-binding subunit [Haloglycomyces albus]